METRGGPALYNRFAALDSLEDAGSDATWSCKSEIYKKIHLYLLQSFNFHLSLIISISTSSKSHNCLTGLHVLANGIKHMDELMVVVVENVN